MAFAPIVCAGPVRTKLAMAVHTQEIIDAYHDAIPLNRYGTEREIGEAVYFVPGQGSYVTGQTLAVDGGFDASGVACWPCARHSSSGRRRPLKDRPGASAYAVLIAVRPISAIIAARILNFCGLPVTVIGKASLNWI